MPLSARHGAAMSHEQQCATICLCQILHERGFRVSRIYLASRRSYQLPFALRSQLLSPVVLSERHRSIVWDLRAQNLPICS